MLQRQRLEHVIRSHPGAEQRGRRDCKGPGSTASSAPTAPGKTTLFNCVTGLLKPDSGAVWLDGQEITGSRPDRIARKGIRRTFQAGKLVPGHDGAGKRDVRGE